MEHKICLGFRKKKRQGPVVQSPREIPDGLWAKCDSCGEILYKRELAKNLWVCPKCSNHFSIGSKEYLSILLDEGSFEEFDSNVKSIDTLSFYDTKSYADRLQAAYHKSGLNEAVITGIGSINSTQISIAIMDFKFIGGSMGSALGEKVTRAIERALDRKIPLVIVSASGGARMQESILSLMQMAKTGTALTLLHEAGLPFISVLTHPTTAGVMASYASLGDIIIAEPSALLGFAGPRVIQETIGQDLPEGFQSSEFFLEHGFLDLITQRSNLKNNLSKLLTYTYNQA